MKLSIVQKGLLLLAVPLLTQLVFLALAARMRQDHADAEAGAAHTKDVIALTHEVLANAADAQTGSRGYVLTRDPAFATPYDRAARELPANLEALEALVRDNPAQAARAGKIRAHAGELLAWLAESGRLVRAGAAERAVARVGGGDGERRLNDLRRETAEFLAEEERLDRESVARAAAARRRVDWLLGATAVAGLAAAAVTAALFRRGIGRRFEAVVENTRRLAAGKDLSPPLGGGDELARLDAAFRDMAAQMTAAGAQLRETVRQVQDLYDHAPCGYHSLGPDGTVIAVNETEARWLGYAKAELVGRVNYADLLTPAGRDRFRATFPRFKQTGVVSNMEFELVRKDGSTFPVLLSAAAVRDAAGNYLSSRSTLVDITDRKRAEDEVRRLNAELEERVKARTAELAEANRDLTQKNAENEMFVYSVSHDLRSPLVNLQGFSAELGKAAQALAAVLADPAVPDDARAKAQTLLDGKMAKSLGFIRAAVSRLSAIIDALLRLSRVGRVEYRWEEVDVGRVVRRVLDSMQAVIGQKRATVTVGDLPPVWGDPTALEQLFANLIGNALAYLDPARPGVIEVGYRSAGEPGNGEPAYYVQDNGLGIPAAHRGKIFQVFQRAHPGVGSGEGIGLAIVARVAERHGGRVWVESTPGAGSTFFVTLRAARPATLPTGAPRCPPGT